MANKYDANGNLTKRGSDTFTYDYEDRLIQSNIDGALAEYRYDGIGNRLEKTDEETTTRYVLDTNGSLSNVLAETDDSGDITAYYVYGLGLLSKILPDGTTYYYHYDSRGSAVALTDADENITDAYAYDSFGRLANSTGTTTNPFKCVGRYGVMDEGNGISYIRARYYMPETGRFIAKDPITGNDRDGQGLNRYVYAVNNPVRLVDISGYSALEGNVSQDNSGSSDTLHSWLIDRERRKKEYRAQAMMAWNDYVAALETEAAYWEAWINTLEAIHGALDAVRGLYIQGPKGVGGGIGEMVSVLTRTLGYQKTSETIDVGLNAYRVYEMFDAIRGLPEQIQSTKTVFNAIHNVGIGGVNWENVLKTDAASNVGNLYKDVILLPNTLWGLISN